MPPVADPQKTLRVVLCYAQLEEFESRFPPGGAPPLRHAERLVVRGDVTFEAGVVVRGSVQLEAAESLRVASGTALQG